MAGLYTGATGLWGGFTGLLFGPSALSTPPGLLADVIGPPGINGILLEGSTTDFLMLEDGTSYLLQE